MPAKTPGVPDLTEQELRDLELPVPSLRVYRMHPMAALPVRKTSGSLGYDLAAFALDKDGRSNNIIIGPQGIKIISTMLILYPPPGWAIELRMRSGLAKDGYIIPNAPATYDLDYTGEASVIIGNISHKSRSITHGMRIAQVVLVPAAPPFPVEELKAPPPDDPKNERKDRGIGSTGR